ncbi:MAG: AIR synthase-related protein [Desulfobacterales bacterium]|jgi:hydrogenase maturation factor/phosphoglycolate phosphatase-like HAD superfamily hydrolase
MKKNRPIRIKAILFCFSETIVQHSQQIDKELKAAIGCPFETALIEYVQNLPESDQSKQILSNLDAQELKAAAKLNPDAAFLETIPFLISKKLRLGIISTMSRKAVRHVLQRFRSIPAADIEVIISRAELMQLAPETNLIDIAAEKMNIAAENLMIVTTNVSEIQAGQKAGAITVQVDPDQKSKPLALTRDFGIQNIQELKDIVRMGTPLPTGKLPNDLLRDFLNQFIFTDPTVLINPGVGEDIAAVDIESKEVLVLKSDPITFATDSIGQYAVLVNANDIATSGATPKWFLTTLFFPCGITASQIQHVVAELTVFCQRWDIILCGGHTEITDAVTRPIIAGMMAGTVSNKNLIDKRNMEKGDRIFLTKSVAVEGTAIIAREFGERLKKMGMTKKEIDHCSRFLDNISVIAEAKIAAVAMGTSAMHDVTEGGLATALEELSIAGNHKIKIDIDKIPVFTETRKISRLLDIDPLGLIGSGSLLICCHKEGCDKLTTSIRDAGIDIACIGEVKDRGQGVYAYRKNRQVSWPAFEVDEITKLF